MNHEGPIESRKRWPLFTLGEQKYVGLNTEPLKIHKGLRNQLCAFWNRFLPRLLNITGVWVAALPSCTFSNITCNTKGRCPTFSLGINQPLRNRKVWSLCKV